MIAPPGPLGGHLPGVRRRRRNGAGAEQDFALGRSHPGFQWARRRLARP